VSTAKTGRLGIRNRWINRTGKIGKTGLSDPRAD
jgi:hypothetical protein